MMINGLVYAYNTYTFSIVMIERFKASGVFNVIGSRLIQLPQHKSAHLTAVIMLTLIASALIVGASNVRADEINPVPSPDYEPEQVVKIVVDSLQNNSEPGDQGIATVFRFASPGNRATTGPLERFTRMIKGGFSDMLNHEDARFDPMKVSGDTAVQAVWLLTNSGKEVGYAFQLSRQQSGEFEGIWMTDAVVPLGEGPRSGTKI